MIGKCLFGERLRRVQRFTALLFLLLLFPFEALAGGMFLPGRGARPLGRAGSFVAGADDLEAVYYNPAGLSGTGHLSLMVDAGLIFQSVNYTRTDSGGTAQPTVSDNNGILPIPFLGISWRPEALDRRLTFAFAAFVPYTGIPRYPEKGPQRYSLVSLDGTALAVAELAVSVRVLPEFYIGAGFQAMFVSLSNRTTLSACASQLQCAPESPAFDSVSQTKTVAPFTPSGNFGLLYVNRYARIGASLQLPYLVRATGTVAARLPSDPMFDGAKVEGSAITASLNLPMVLRGGVEVRPTKRVRVEVGVDWEQWSVQDKITFVPQGVYIDKIPGVGRYDLRALTLDRSMRDTISFHVGGEVDAIAHRLTIRAGYLYETSAVPDETLTVLTPDGDKHLVTLGAALRLGSWRVDVAYGHFFQADRLVTTSRSYQLNPIVPSIQVAVGNGLYAVSTDVLSLGFEKRF